MSTKVTILMWTIAVLATLPARAAELLMFEEPGCVWCQRWHAEIGAGYSNSDEGRAAPLRRIDLRNGTPVDIGFERPVTMTPTFVLVEDGRERGRIVGYPGAHFFYPLLAELLKKLSPPQVKTPPPLQRDASNGWGTATR